MNKTEPARITPTGPINATVSAPPAKAYTLRSLFIAALANGTSRINDPLLGEDQRLAIDALRKMGINITEDDGALEITGRGGTFTAPTSPIDIGNSGVSARVLAILCALADGDVTLDGSERMRNGRPISDLIEAAGKVGISIRSKNQNGCPPLYIQGGGIRGGTTELRGTKSSQYFSALLLGAPYAQEDITIQTVGELYSKPYIDITIDVMRDFGAEVTNEDYSSFQVKAGTTYKPRTYRIEGDFSSAAYFFAAAAITGGTVRVTNLNPASAQGDKRFADFLKMMGCSVTRGEDYVEVQGGALQAINVDMQDYPDIVQPLSVVAAFAEGKSEFKNISHLRYKECDRLQAPATELGKMGIEAHASPDKLIVQGGTPHGAEIDTYTDHRMAMSFAVAALKVPDMRIKNPENVNKSFPGFFDALREMGAEVTYE